MDKQKYLHINLVKLFVHIFFNFCAVQVENTLTSDSPSTSAKKTVITGLNRTFLMMMPICALGSERGDAGPAEEREGSGGPQLEARPRNTGRNTTFKQSAKIISAFNFFLSSQKLNNKF